MPHRTPLRVLRPLLRASPRAACQMAHEQQAQLKPIELLGAEGARVLLGPGRS